MSNSENKIIITNFTDPVCTWCWGTEPIFRKLETHFPGKVEFRFVMGGLVKDAHEMMDPANGIGSTDLTQFNRQVAAHWKEASARHGMPVDAENFDLFDEEHRSTYPQNIAYKAAQMSNPDKADLFLYNMRVAAAAEARKISHEDVLVSIASESGLDVESFLTHFKDGSAEKAFHGDMWLISGVGAHGFPTFLIKYNSSQYMLRGYNRYETFVAVINSATQGSVKPVDVEATQENLSMLMEKHPRMAAEEIRQAFDFGTVEQVKDFLAPMVEAGQLEIQNAGNGWFAKRISQGMTCDLTAGLCQ